MDETTPLRETPEGDLSNGLESTQAAAAPETVESVVPDAADNAAPPPVGKSPSLRLVSMLGLLGFVLIAVISAFSGYRAGINARTGAETTQIALNSQEQYELALKDMQDGLYDRARQRLEYVINLDPGFPEAADKLVEVRLLLNATATPSPVPTPTLSPTPDMRGVEEFYASAQQALVNLDWDTALNALLGLRKADPTYLPVWVDGQLYVSYRNRGMDKILKRADLEGGIYDLTLAQRFGLLDYDAQAMQNWSRLYIIGASFWDLDWQQAVYYFGQVAPAAPNLRDGSGWTAVERYRLALEGYGDYLGGQKEWCGAVDQYAAALAYGAEAGVQDKYDFAAEKCSPPSEEEPPSNEPPPEITPPPVEPTPEPTPYP